MKFDSTKPFGEIFGEFGIARYEQGGRYYDAQHNLLADNGMPLKKAGAKPEAEPADDSGATDTGNPTENPDNSNDGLTKDELLAKAKALGIKATKTWGIDKLKEEIAAKRVNLDDEGTGGASAAVDSQVNKNLE